MKALYIDQVTHNPESLQNKNHQTIRGADIFEWSLFSSLLEYGSYDAYLVQGLTEDRKQALLAGGLAEDGVKRLVPAPLGGLLPLRDSDQVVFLTAGRYLNALASIRQKLRRCDGPACGFIHSINSPRVAFSLLQQCFAGLFKTDLLFCSSRAGMKTIDSYIEEINQCLPQALHYPVRRVLVPLGVNLPAARRESAGPLRQRLNVRPEVCIALYFGRLSQASKCDLGPLLVALSQLRRRKKSLYLIIAGDDTQSKEGTRLEQLARELSCQEHVRIWPNPTAEEKHALYAGADFFVSPSDNLQETFGLAVAEAMAYGLPALVSDWNGYRDLVTDGENGFLVPSVLPPAIKDLHLCDCATSMLEEDSLAESTTIDIRSLSERMEKLAEDPQLRARMGQCGRQFVENHCSWQVVVKRYEELWEESLEAARAVRVPHARTGGIPGLSLEKCFGHYATAKRESDQKCFITAEGREWLKRPGRFYFLGQISSVPCPQKFANILREISNHPGISVSTVAESLSKNSEPENAAEAHWALARLFKYGLVTHQQAESQE